MNDLRAAAQQALEALENAEEDGNCEYGATAALRAALAQQEQQEQCADESDCTHMPWCRVRKTCQRAALAQREQEPLSVEDLARALVASRVIDAAALDDPEGYDDGVMLERVRGLHRRLAALEQQEQEPVEIKPPNPEGATQCIVRWFAETPAGWVGAWDREALERFTAYPPRRETEQEPVAWMDEFGNAFPLGAVKGAGSWRDDHQRNWTPLYTHPPRREWRSLSEGEILPLYSMLPSSHAEMLEFARAIEDALKERNT
jgi:hypothetical protein